jgi:UDP-glucose 4-epimerase
MMKRVTVFGGSGFLGSHVCEKLSDAGYQVVIFDQVPSPWLREDQQMLIRDILNESDVARAVEGAEIVFNFAGIADIGEADERPSDTIKYNILGNAHILDACVKEGVKRYVFSSSVYVYSGSGGFYRCSKQACELYIENYHKVHNLEYTILRYGSLYGPRADERNAIFRFVKEAMEKRKISYSGKSEALREYIHVEDAAKISVEILLPEYANEHIVLTGHQPMTVGNLFKMIEEILGYPVESDFENSQDNGHYVISPYSFSPKIGKKLTPPLHVDLGQGILRMIEDLHKTMHPELHNVKGYLIKE